MSTNTIAFTLLRWASLVWLLIWLPANTWAWGWQNLMHICDVGLVLVCLGLWLRQPLLVSSQTLYAPLVGVLWSLDVVWRLVTSHHLIGGTEYMWDTNYPLWIRLLSGFHIVLPLLLLWAIRVLGYDRRALSLQIAITGALLVFSRFLSPQLNMNYAFQDPLFHRAWGPAPVHLAVILAGCVVIFFWPTHFLLSRFFPSANTDPSFRTESAK
ncbi:MAG TPA: hypothetical protein VE263_02490 [Candidatus Angelobacter sp.]|nr:hypothetical protein [Candidatus Angelobacter sp.]